MGNPVERVILVTLAFALIGLSVVVIFRLAQGNDPSLKESAAKLSRILQGFALVAVVVGLIVAIATFDAMAAATIGIPGFIAFLVSETLSDLASY